MKSDRRSVTTSMAAMQLAEKGVIDIADEIFKPLRVNRLLVSGGRIANRDNRSAASNGQFRLRDRGYDS